MTEQNAIRVAIDILHVPSRVPWARSQPLPGNITPVLQIAAGNVDVERALAEQTGRSRQLIHDAAVFFVEQILLAPDADAYRRLGASPHANQAELRRHLTLLLKSMHPDRMNGDRSLFAHRIIDAWDLLKTPSRRAAYDESLQRRNGPDRPKPFARTPRRRRKRQEGTSDSIVLVNHSARALDPHPRHNKNIIQRVLRYFFARVQR